MKFWSLYILTISILMLSCQSKEANDFPYNVLVVVAHPDDETLISGTLAKLSSGGSNINIIYTTSGDDGPDKTGRKLWGEALGKEREKEAQKSLMQIGINNSPLFLRFPDSHVWEHKKAIRDTLVCLIQLFSPDLVITFGPDGVTDDLDHITTGKVTDEICDSTGIGKLLLHMAISQQASYIYPIPAPVPNHMIDIKVNVFDFKRNRFKSNSAHRTQFGLLHRAFWKSFVRNYPYEEFIIETKREKSVRIIKDLVH